MGAAGNTAAASSSASLRRARRINLRYTRLMSMRMAMLLSSLLVFSVPLPAFAQAGGAATDHIKEHHGQIRRILGRRAPTETAREARKNQVTGIIRELLDLDTMGQRALGRHWEERSAAERQAFLRTLRQLVERSYRRSLEGTQNYRIRYLGESEANAASERTVQTSARDHRNRRAPAVTIDYLVMPKEGGGFSVIDITTDGVSMVGNYRSQFSRILRREGWDRLMERMSARLADGS